MDFEKIKNGFNQYFVNVIRSRYIDFNGRASRSQYWYYTLCYIIVSIPFSIFDSLFKTNILTLILALGLLLPSLAIGIRRLHDINKSGWWYLIALIPIAGPIALIVMFCLPSLPALQNRSNSDNAKKAA